MTRKTVEIALGFLSAVAALALVVGCPPADGGEPDQFEAQLSGIYEVPPVTTAASGVAEIDIEDGDQAITYRLEAQNITNVVAAHIHVGPEGVNGPIIFFLFDVVEGPFVSPVTGTLTAADFIPAGGLATFEDALAAIRAGNTYVNIHTLANPMGEIRGQLFEVAN